MKLFLDTNFIISAFATRGLSADLFASLIQEYEVLIAECVLKEFQTKMKEKFKIPEHEVNEIVVFLREFTIVEDSKTIKHRTRDKDDDIILNTAIESQAHVLITGDKDLLELEHQALSISILSPRQFWEKHLK